VTASRYVTNMPLCAPGVGCTRDLNVGERGAMTTNYTIEHPSQAVAWDARRLSVTIG